VNVLEIAEGEGEAVAFRKRESRGARVVRSRVRGARDLVEDVRVAALAAEAFLVDLLRDGASSPVARELQRRATNEVAGVRG
jgi:hypothetical protein